MNKEDKKMMTDLDEKMNEVISCTNRTRYKVESLGVIIVIVAMIVVAKVLL